MKKINKLFAVLLFFFAVNAQAHDLHHEVAEGQAAVVRFFFVDNSPFAYENYELYREGDALPYQTGRTDAHGYLSFIPDSASIWHVKVFSEDGHGASFDITTQSDLTVVYVEKPFVDRYGRIVIGVAVLFGLFGLFSLVLRWRKRRA